MKKLLVLIAVLTLALALTGCGRTNTSANDLFTDVEGNTPSELIEEQAIPDTISENIRNAKAAEKYADDSATDNALAEDDAPVDEIASASVVEDIESFNDASAANDVPANDIMNNNADGALSEEEIYDSAYALGEAIGTVLNEAAEMESDYYNAVENALTGEVPETENDYYDAFQRALNGEMTEKEATEFVSDNVDMTVESIEGLTNALIGMFGTGR